jgi:molybdopterin/thiamine biosynthesis adenylyltransferase
MLKKPRIITHKGEYVDEFYSNRVNRNGCFLGATPEEQRSSQEKLRNSVVGIAGCGGIGGLLAMTLARLGVCHMKLADPDSFEVSNINRQLGAGEKTIGKNKAIVVGELVRDMVSDVTVEVYPEGIQLHTAESFLEGCDLVFDQTDVYLIAERYALHRAFQEHKRTKYILASCVWGWGANVYKFERGGVTLEDLFGIREGKKLDREDVHKLLVMQLNYLPRFPSLQGIFDWMGEVGNVPINAVTPPLSCYLLAARAALVLCDLERQPYCEPLPPVPDYYWFDAATWHSGFHKFDGNWVNPLEYENHFGKEHVS